MPRRSHVLPDDLRSQQKKKCEQPLLTHMTVTEFYEREDREAMSMEMSSVEKNFLEHSSMLRQRIAELSSMDNESSEDNTLDESILSRFISLRRLNRLAQFRNRKIRDRVDDVRRVVERLFLKLQNVKSEIAHIQKVINRCYEFRSADENMNLASLEEFKANAPESFRTEAIMKNPHKLHLSRLNWEMLERKTLVGTLLEREGRKSVLISDMGTKEHRLKTLKPKLEAVIEAARPVYELMGLNTGSIDAEKEKVLSMLPQELSVIVILVEAYCEINEESGIILKCKGDYESAERFMEEQVNLEEILDEDDEESEQTESKNEEQTLVSETSKRRPKTLSERLTSRKEVLTAAHPIHLDIEITCEEGISVSLTLQLVPSLRAIGVKASLHEFPDYHYTNALCNDTFLLELFPGDDGSRCCNDAAEAKLSILRVSVMDLEDKVGRFYHFAQRMAGLEKGAVDASQTYAIIGMVVERLRARASSRFALALTVEILHTLKLFEEMTTKTRDLFPSKIFAKLSEFCMVTPEKFVEDPLVTNRYRTLIEKECRNSFDKQFYFVATIEGRASEKLKALVYVDVTYPENPPLFILGITLHGKSYTSSTWSFLNHLERAVNIYFPTTASDEDRNELLGLQMAFLVSRFDVMLECSSTAAERKNFPLEHLFFRTTRGRDREFPLCYDMSNNSFSFDK